MTETWTLAAIWLGLALIAALFSVWLRIATALSEIVIGTLAQFILGIAFGASVLQADLPWIKFLAGSGAILLTELDPAVLRVRWKEATAVGLMSFLAPFIGCASVGKDHVLIRRLRTLTLGLLTPFYFIRAGSLVSIPALVSAPAVFFLLLVTKLITKMLGVYPVTKLYRAPTQEAIYTTLLMSTGLTFGTISALYGLSHQVIDHAQYSFLVAAVIGSAVVPTLIANAFFLPRHLLAKPPAAPTPPLEPQPATSSAKVYPASESN